MPSTVGTVEYRPPLLLYVYIRMRSLLCVVVATRITEGIRRMGPSGGDGGADTGRNRIERAACMEHICILIAA